MQGDICFAVYGNEHGHLHHRDLLHAIRKREGNMIYSKQMLGLDKASDKNIFACLQSMMGIDCCIMGCD